MRGKGVHNLTQDMWGTPPHIIVKFVLRLTRIIKNKYIYKAIRQKKQIKCKKMTTREAREERERMTYGGKTLKEHANEYPTEKLLNDIEVVGVKEVKKQKVSASLTLKSFNENVKKLIELGLVEEKEQAELEKIRRNMVDKWLG